MLEPESALAAAAPLDPGAAAAAGEAESDAMSDPDDLANLAEVAIPAPLAPAPKPVLAVGRFAPGSVDAEDCSRRLGNWGGASHLIGSRWEALAPELLRRRLPWRLELGGGHMMLVEALLSLDADAAAGPALQRAGVSAPDLLLAGRLPSAGADRLALRATDCKVSLDTADREQTAAARLQATFARIQEGFPAVAAVLRRQAAALPSSATAAGALEAALAGDWERVVAGEGLYVAPDNGFNRWFLDQLAHRRRTGAPLGRLPVSGPRRSAAEMKGPVGVDLAARLTLPAHLEPTSALDFLGTLPGWPEAGVIAELDAVDLTACDLAVAERCWRVAAGLRGAVLALRRKLFHPALSGVDARGRPRDVVALLRQAAARRRAGDSADLVAAVAHAVEQRRPLWDREADVLRPPLSFGAWMSRIHEALRAVYPDLRQAPSGRSLHRQMAGRHRQRVLRAARDLASDGLDELHLLAALEARAPEWQAAAEADAKLLVSPTASF